MLNSKNLNLSETEFREVYSIFWRRLYGLAYNYVRDKTIAREVVQDVFVKLWQKRNTLEHVRDLDSYLLTCVKHRVYEHFEKIAIQERLKKQSLKTYSEEIHPVEEEIAYNETLEMINRELDKLPATTRTIFKMSKFERYSNKEIASHLHVSSKAVEYHISRALKRLRVHLSHTPVILFMMAIPY